MNSIDYSTQTVLITGASSGLGEQFARALASKGARVVLVARRESRLRAIAHSIEVAYGVQTDIIQCDLSRENAGDTLFRMITERGIPITALINNAGFATFGPVHDNDPSQLHNEMNVNMVSLVDLTRAFLPDFRLLPASFIINVSSVAGFLPAPGMNVYAASKAFVLHFSEALWQESRGTNVRVLALCPGTTKTEFFNTDSTHNDQKAKTSSVPLALADPADVVAFALRKLTKKRTPPSAIPGITNKAAPLLGRLLSRRMVITLSALAIAGLVRASAASPSQQDDSSS